MTIPLFIAAYIILSGFLFSKTDENNFNFSDDNGQEKTDALTRQLPLNEDCEPFAVPIIEDFDELEPPELPACWSKIEIGEGAEVKTTSNGYINNGVLLSKNVWSFAEQIVLLASPEIEVAINELRIKFVARTEVGGMIPSDPFLQIGTMSNQADISTFQLKEEILLDTYWNMHVIYFNTYQGTDKFIAFKMGSEGNEFGGYAYIDDIIIETIPVCLEPLPFSMSSSNYTINSATLSWEDQGNPSHWQIQWGLSGFQLGEGTIEHGVNSNPYTLEGIEHSTTYDYYVRVDCGGGEFSTWEGPHTFTTAFMAPYLQDFDSSLNLPEGWNGDFAIYQDRGVNDSNSLSAYIFQIMDVGALCLAQATTPVFKINQGPAYQVKFDYRLVNSESEAYQLAENAYINVQYATDHGETYTTLHTIDSNNHTPATQYQELVLDIPPELGGHHVQFRIEHHCGGSYFYYVDIDNFQIKASGQQGLILDFGAGFTWFSVNVNPGSMHPNDLFSDLMPCEDDRIIGQSGFATYFNDTWIGSLTAINSHESYVMELCSEQSISLVGTPVPINALDLNAGFTWLGYLPQTSHPINDALSNINPTPAVDDRLIGQSSFATYFNNQWIGSLTHMNPGYGYIIDLSHGVSLSYPDGTAKHDGAPGELQKPLLSPTGQNPAENMQHNMTMIAQLITEDGRQSFNNNDVVYAFVGDECRGIANVTEHNGTLFLTIGSNLQAGEAVNFRVWLDEANELFEIRESVSFEAFRALGTMGNPFILTLDAPLGEGFAGHDNWYIGDPYPNPLTGSTYIPYHVGGSSEVSLKVFNSIGQLVFSFTDTNEQAGNHQLTFERGSLQPGVYHFRMEISAGENLKMKTGRVVLM